MNSWVSRRVQNVRESLSYLLTRLYRLCDHPSRLYKSDDILSFTLWTLATRLKTEI